MMTARLMRGLRHLSTTPQTAITLFISGIYIFAHMQFREILDNKYIILKKIGWGHFSTVWLAFNNKDKKLYALKIMRSHSRYIQVGFSEETINRIIAESHDHPSWVKSV